MNASIKAEAKRYRYTGKERDEESGLYYHGARYYIPWLARWTAIDPMEAKYAGMSPYNYSFNNPVVWNDLSGRQPGDGDKNWYPPMAAPSTVDNTYVYTFNPYEQREHGHLTPDGGRIRLPKGSTITDTVSETGEYMLSGKDISLPVGAVLSWQLEGLDYHASFDLNNKFVGYYTSDKKHGISYDGNTIPYKLNTSEAGAFMLAGWTTAGQTALADGPEPGPADVGGLVVGLGTTILSGLILLDAKSGYVSMTKPQDIAVPWAPAIPVTTTVPEPPPLENFLYRFDTRSPDEIIKEGGFRAWGENYNLMHHATGISIKNKTSAYISTSKSPTVVMEELWKGRRDGFLYIIKNQPTSIDVNAELGASSPFPLQQEVAVPKFIPIMDIRFVMPLKSTR